MKEEEEETKLKGSFVIIKVQLMLYTFKEDLYTY